MAYGWAVDATYNLTFFLMIYPWVIFIFLRVAYSHGRNAAPPNPIRTYDFISNMNLARHTKDMLTLEFDVSNT
jgi:hypothetical protein